ncbi:hypothetical protein [Pseudodonghicola xiamenensis]|uniref:SmpA / OmlA family protein n=1 Tax=Pseudodonghicola xiamenensis TaxID=337702 RepID=A0A8J3MEK6_9RHOB|nr:hypothetical protein [Pseudodonghicola xiamenensis]GHH04816.1 hypothetical protein GCM10010961_43410 [Pseudodonghicola xiamenensis]
MKRLFGGRSALLATALLVLLPFGASAAQDDDPLNQVNSRVKFSSVSRAYASMDATYARIGTRREIAQVRRVALGQSEADLQAVLGRPAIGYDDGSFEFHLSLPLTRSDRLICQYRVFLDGEGKVERGVWRRPQCANLVVGREN